MFQSEVRFPIVATLDYDPGADDVIPLWRCPSDLEGAVIKGAMAVVANDVAASTTNYFSLNLLNGGTAGTATTAISSTIGGTAGWSGLTPKSFTISAGTIAAGEVVCLKYDEEGTGTFTQLTVQLDVVYK